MLWLGRRGFGAHSNAHTIASVGKGSWGIREKPGPFMCALSFLRNYSWVRFPSMWLLFVHRAVLLKVRVQLGASFFPVNSYLWVLWALSRLSEVGSLCICGSLQHYPPEHPRAVWHFLAFFIKAWLYPKAAKNPKNFFFSLTLLNVAKTE